MSETVKQLSLPQMEFIPKKFTSIPQGMSSWENLSAEDFKRVLVLTGLATPANVDEKFSHYDSGKSKSKSTVVFDSTNGATEESTK